MRLQADKIASSTGNLRLQRSLVLGPVIPAAAGAVVAVRVLDEKSIYNQIEDLHGRMMTVHRGDIVVGVLGSRRALRGYAGEVPERVEVGDVLHLLNLGGVIGRCTASHPDLGLPARVEVLGSVLAFPERGERSGLPASILPGVVPLRDRVAGLPPTVLFAGTCMHVGKTAAACTLVRRATVRGLRVGAAKLTGVALRRDTLDMLDHGAVAAYTFVDAGLPSTCDGDVVRAAHGVLGAVADVGVDLIVAELGDGILGEYGVREVLGSPWVRGAVGATVLAAADPVGAWGGVHLLASLGYRADLITGPSTDNAAGSEAIAATTGVLGCNARLDPERFGELVLGALGLGAAGAPRLALAGAS